MAARYLCPNDSEVMVIETLPGSTNKDGAMNEQYRCPFCHYSKDKATVQGSPATHKIVDEGYRSPRQSAKG